MQQGESCRDGMMGEGVKRRYRHACLPLCSRLIAGREEPNGGRSGVPDLMHKSVNRIQKSHEACTIDLFDSRGLSSQAGRALLLEPICANRNGVFPAVTLLILVILRY